MPKERNYTVGIIVFVIAVIVGGLLVDYFVKEPTADQEPIKIGFIGPLTGPVANPGVYIKNGFDVMRKSQTINGREVKIIYEDGMCNPKEAVNAAEKLLNVDNVDVVVSAICGGSTLAIAPLTEEAGKILVSPVSTTPAISDAGEYVFRISTSADLFARNNAQKIKELGYDSVGIIFENTEYGVGWKESFVSSFDGEISLIESFEFNAPDIRTQLLKVAESQPEALLFIVQSPLSAANLVKQAKELGIEKQLIGNEAFFSRQVVKTLMGDAAEGLLILTYEYDLNNDMMQRLFLAYQKEYDEVLPEELYAALGADAYGIIYDAMDSCGGPDAECMRDYFYGVENRRGASGIFSIDEKGDGVREFKWWAVRDNEIVPLG